MNDQNVNISNTIADLAARWNNADNKLLRQVFPMLAEGRPVEVERIAERTGTTVKVVQKALVNGRASRDSYGHVIELSGLMLDPTLHRIEVKGIALFSCCALLAHMTPFFLGRPVILESVDPQNRGIIRLEINSRSIESITPSEAVGTFVVTKQHELDANIREAFCSHVHHFTDLESAKIYASSDVRRYVLGIEELRSAAEDLYQAVWA